MHACMHSETGSIGERHILHTFMHACIGGNLSETINVVCELAYMHTYTHRKHISIRAYTNSYKHTYIPAYIHTYIHTYTWNMDEGTHTYIQTACKDACI
jgi:hypothetical protein